MFAVLAGLAGLAACERIVDLTIYPDSNTNPDAPDDSEIDAFEGEDGGIEDAADDGGSFPDSSGADAS